MATDNSSYFSNAYPGVNTCFDGNIYRLDATPKYPLGFQVTRADGAKFRYAQFGAATNRGVVVAQDYSETSIADTDNGIVAPASANDTTDGTIGSRFIQITMSGVIKDQFAGGYLVITDDTGEGYTYRIKGNTATGTNVGSDTDAYRLELYEKLQVAVTTDTDYAITGCMWNDLEVATAATDMIVAGVSCATTTSALPFAFVQTHGVVGVLQDANLPAAGDAVTVSIVTAGAVGAFLDSSVGTVAAAGIRGNQVIGYCIDPGDSTGHSTIFLTLPE